MKQPIILFGLGDIAQLANYYFEIDSAYEVVAFTVDAAYKTCETFENKPVISFEEVEKHYSPSQYKMFIALSYAQLNKLRTRKCEEAISKGYELVSYISSKCSYLSQHKPGFNAFILEDNTIQPYVKIGDNVTLWSGNHIGHHSTINSNNFISSHVVISGHCTVESNCFIGVNSTIGHGVVIGKENIIGAGTILTKSTSPQEVHVPARSTKLDKPSTEIKL